jgi:hypothetical protein
VPLLFVQPSFTVIKATKFIKCFDRKSPGLGQEMAGAPGNRLVMPRFPPPVAAPTGQKNGNTALTGVLSRRYRGGPATGRGDFRNEPAGREPPDRVRLRCGRLVGAGPEIGGLARESDRRGGLRSEQNMACRDLASAELVPALGVDGRGHQIDEAVEVGLGGGAAPAQRLGRQPGKRSGTGPIIGDFPRLPPLKRKKTSPREMVHPVFPGTGDKTRAPDAKVLCAAPTRNREKEPVHRGQIRVPLLCCLCWADF